MKIAVLSGKGGAGKTFVSTNLSCALGRGAYVDCDVEEPNGHLFLKPKNIEKSSVFQLIPSFEPEKCTGCRECVKHCRFNALIYIKKKPMVFTEVCHSCGLCSMVCPQNAICEEERPLGHLEIGNSGSIRVITGYLNPGEASGIPVIRSAQQAADSLDPVIYDCPPGSACSVQESIQNADFCLLVVEPTAFGFHTFKMVEELVRLHKKRCGVIIDKETASYPPLEDFCRIRNLPILMRIPFRKDLAAWISQGELAVNQDPGLKESFQRLYEKIGGESV